MNDNGRPPRRRMNGRAIERRNLLIFTTIAYEAEYGAYLPVVDEGIDLILLRERDGKLRKVQMKTRWTIHKKYLGRGIWVAFPYEDRWYLAPHDDLVQIARELDFGINSADYLQGRAYHRETLGERLTYRMRSFIFPEPPV